LSNDRGKKANSVSPAPTVARHKRRNFTAEVYGARLEFEDARIIDDYAKANKRDRSEVVREGLHLFALRQQMLRTKKDPLRELLEQVVAEQITPFQQRTEEMMTLLNDIVNFIIEQSQSDAVHPAARNAGEVVPTQSQGRIKSPIEQALAAQRGLIEQTLMTVTLGLRLLVDYLIDPMLRAGEARSDDEVAKRLEAAIRAASDGPEPPIGSSLGRANASCSSRS
jgi:hypothetical protein